VIQRRPVMAFVVAFA